ncbi:MAG: hypothetical protein RL068_939 [Actinomycetota bacterium]
MRLTLALSMLILQGSGVANGSPVAPNQIPVGNDEALVYISEQEDVRIWGSQLMLQPGKPDENLVRDPWIECESVKDPVCDFAKPNYNPSASINLGKCENGASENCLVGLRVKRDGVLLPAEFVSAVPGTKTFPAAPELGLFETGAASLFDVPGAPHSGGTLYLAGARVTSNYDAKTKRFVHTDMYVTIYPVALQGQNFSRLGANSCLWNYENQCGEAVPFPKGLTFGVELRVVNELGGWFLGRFQSPNIQVAKFSNTNNQMVVDAEPVEVPRFAYLTKKSELTAADKIAVGNVGGTNALFEDRPARLGNDGFDTSVFGMLAHFKDRVSDTATATTSHWRMRTTSRNGGNKCLTQYDKVLGIVSTNATAYDGFAPQFKDGYLDYKVAGLHYSPDGKTLNFGTYDLVISSETARCLYGFTNAPVSATVTVVGTGDQNVASTVVSEKDGWLKLAAYGFTFSEKEIKVKLSQPLTKSLTKFSGSSKTLSAKQKAEVSALMKKVSSNPKFICTGTYVKPSDKAIALSRAKAVCNYAKGIDKNHSFFAQAKQTTAKSYDAKVMVSSK